MRLPKVAHQFEYLCRTLSFEADVQEVAVDLGARDGDEFWREAASLALVPGLLPAVCYRRLSQYVSSNSGPSAVSESYTEGQVRKFITDHNYRCEKQHARLLEAVCALNASGIVPMLMTGTRAIWLRDPAWQFVHRLGLVVPGGQMKLASRALQELGYRNVRRIDASGFQHELHFFRPDLNGVLALRDMGSHTQLKELLGGNEVASLSRVVTIDGAQVRLPAKHVGIICDLLHRHYRRPGFGTSVITLKELYEFSWALAGLDQDERSKLEALSLQYIDVGKVLAVWGDEAHRAFGITLPWLSALNKQLTRVRRPVIKTVLVTSEPWLGVIPIVTPLLYRLSSITTRILGWGRRTAGGRYNTIDTSRTNNDRHRRDRA